MPSTDPALDALFLPFREARLKWPQRALFLRARWGGALQEHAGPGLVCEQTYKPEADALARAGLQVSAGSTERFPLVLVLPPRQREEARALLARAIAVLEPGGCVIACAGNNDGARSMEADLARLAGPLETMSKHKHRVCWSGPIDRPADAELAAQWRTLDAIRPIADGRFVSRPGVFAWDRIDVASAVLAEHLPHTLAGRAADLGAGFGYLSAELLERCPRIEALDLYEAEARALELARQNLARYAERATLEFLWADVTAGLTRTYDVIVMNPPFHTRGGAERPDVGRRFIAVAAAALTAGGRLWLVANRHLPYEAALDASFGRVRVVAQVHGYKIIEAVRTRS